MSSFAMGCLITCHIRWVWYDLSSIHYFSKEPSLTLWFWPSWLILLKIGQMVFGEYHRSLQINHTIHVAHRVFTLNISNRPTGSILFFPIRCVLFIIRHWRSLQINHTIHVTHHVFTWYQKTIHRRASPRLVCYHLRRSCCRWAQLLGSWVYLAIYQSYRLPLHITHHVLPLVYQTDKRTFLICELRPCQCRWWLCQLSE